MRILLLTQFYPPESGAPQNRLSDLAKRLKAAGHHVEVLTAMPNYPKGVIFDGYRRRVVMEEERDGVRVIRTWIFAGEKSGFVRRLLTYFSFVISSLIVGARSARRPDAVIVELPPLFLGLSGYAISRLRRARLVLNVSDLWPESAVAMGILRSRFLIRASTRLEEFLYRRADLITGQTEGIMQSVRSRFPTKRLGLITNGVDLSAFREPSPPEESRILRREFGLGEDFVVGYAGLHGHAQGLETILRAAQLLENAPDVVFALFGEGPLKADLVAQARGARNVRFIAAQPSARMRKGPLDLRCRGDTPEAARLISGRSTFQDVRGYGGRRAARRFDRRRGAGPSRAIESRDRGRAGECRGPRAGDSRPASGSGSPPNDG